MRLAGRAGHLPGHDDRAVGVLAKDGFEADTVARFLLDEKMQEAAAGGRVVVDETSMLGHKDAVRLFQLAEKLDLKLIFVGDPMQHGAVPRGALMRVLKEYGGIKPFRLTEILRQENPDYRAAAKLLSEGKTLEGFDALDAPGLGRGDRRRRRPLPAHRRRLPAGPRRQEIGAGRVSPTHAEAAAITAAIRSRAAAGRASSGRRTTSSPGWCRSMPARPNAGRRPPTGRAT